MAPAPRRTSKMKGDPSSKMLSELRESSRLTKGSSTLGAEVRRDTAMRMSQPEIVRRGLENVPEIDIRADHTNAIGTTASENSRMQKMRARMNSVGIEASKLSKFNDDYANSFDGTADVQPPRRPFKMSPANKFFPKVIRPLQKHEQLLAKVNRQLSRERSRDLADPNMHPLKSMGRLSIENFDTIQSIN